MTHTRPRKETEEERQTERERGRKRKREIREGNKNSTQWSKVSPKKKLELLTRQRDDGRSLAWRLKLRTRNKNEKSF